MRFHPIIRFFKENLLYKLKNIDRVEVYTSTFLPFWRKEIIENKLQLVKPAVEVLNELSHEVDLIRYLFGDVKLKFSNIFNSKKLEINTEDHSNVIFGLKKYPKFLCI